MSESLLDRVIQRRLAIQERSTQARGIPGETSDLQRAVARQQAKLQASLEERVAIEEEFTKSIQGQRSELFGLSPDNPLEKIRNLGANWDVGVNRATGRVIAAPDNFNVAVSESAVEPEDVEAFRRYQQDRDSQTERQTIEDRQTRYAEQEARSREAEAASPLYAPGGPREGEQAGELSLAPVSPEDQLRLEALRARTPEATQEDLERLERPVPPKTPQVDGPQTTEELVNNLRYTQPDNNPTSEPKTVRELLESAESSRGRSEAITEFFDISEQANQGAQQTLQADLGRLFDQEGKPLKEAWSKIKDEGVREGALEWITALAPLLVDATKIGLSNPEGVAQFMLEELGEDVSLQAIPKVGTLINAVSNASRALENYNEGLAEFERKEGRAAGDEEKEYFALMATTAFVLDHVGDTGAGWAVGLNRLPGALGTAGGMAAPLARVPVSGALQGGTEALQTAAEGEATYNPATGRDMFVAGMMGKIYGATSAAPGAALEAGQTAAKEGALLIMKRMDQLEKERKVSEEPGGAVEEAKKTGEVAPLLERGANYNPVEAIRILAKRSAQEEMSEEDHQTTLTESQSVLASVSEDLEEAELAWGNVSPEAEEAYKRGLRNTRERLKTVDVESEEYAALKEEEQAYQGALKEVQSTTLADRNRISEQYRTAKARVAEIEALVASIDKRAQQEVDLEDAVNTVTYLPADKDAEQAADAIVRMAMANTDALSDEQLTELVSDTGNGLSDEQRSYLRAFSEARVATNALLTTEGVTTQIFEGGTGFVGLNQYRNRIRALLETGNLQGAQKQLDQLKRFVDQHSGKLVAMEEGFARIEGKWGKINFMYGLDGKWHETNQKITQQMRDENGGLTVYGQSEGFNRLMAAVKLEVPALHKTAQELEHAIKLYEGGVVTPRSSAAAPSTTAQQESTSAAPTTTMEEASASVGQESTNEASQAGTTQSNDPTPTAETETTVPAPDVTATQQQASTDVQQESPTTAEPEVVPADPMGHAAASIERLAGMVADIDNAAEPRTDGELDELEGRFTEASKEATELFTSLASNHPDEAVRAQAQYSIDNDQLGTADLGLALEEMQELLGEAQESAPAELSPGEAYDSATGMMYDIETGEVITPESKPETVRERAVKAGAGRLKAVASLAQKTASNLGKAAYKGANTIAHYMTQPDSTQPLVTVKDFLSEARKGGVEFLQKFLPDDLEGRQAQLLELFFDYAQEWNQEIRDNLTDYFKKQKEYHWNDMTFHLRDPETGELEENARTAIMASMFSWVMDNGGQPRVMAEREINKILGRKEDARVSTAAWGLLGTAGTRETVMINELGNRAVQALGLRQLVGPGNELEKLKGALGAHALAVLAQQGFVEIHGISSNAISLLRQESKDSEVTEGMLLEASTLKEGFDVQENFVRLVRDPQGMTSEETREIVEAAKATKSVFPNLFGMEKGTRGPTSKKTPYKQRAIKGTDRGVPQRLREILEKEAEKAHYFREDALPLWNALYQHKDALARMAGAVDERTWIQRENRLPAEGKNSGVTREIEHLQDLVNEMEQGSGTKAPFFFDRFVGKPQRVFINSNTVNPQTSKIHRHFIKMGGWDTRTNLRDTESWAPTSYNAFMTAVAEAFGVKTEELGPEQAVKDIENILAQDDVRAAVNAVLESISTARLTDAQVAVIERVVTKREGMHTLDALQALALMEQAKKAGESQFTHSLTREIDGKTNGPMLAMAQIAAAMDPTGYLSRLLAGGFLSGDVTQFHEWAGQPGNQDLYKQLASSVVGFVRKDQQDAKKRPVYEALAFFTGDLGTEDKVSSKGRNLVKQPLTAMMFGASVRNTIIDMADEFVDSIYDRIQEIANLKVEGIDADPDHKQMLLDQLIENANTIMGPKSRRNHLRRMTLEQAMNDFRFTPGARTSLRWGYRKTLGEAISAGLDEQFGTFMANRQVLNNAANLAFQLYDMAFEYEREKALVEGMRNGTIDSRPVDEGRKLEPLEDLGQQELAAIREKLKPLEPVVHSAFSKMSGNLDDGIFLSSAATRLSQELPYLNEVALARPVMKNGKPVKKMTGRGYRKIQGDPGVSALILMIHSSDSFIAAMTYAMHQGLNIHDAIMTGLSEVKAVGTDLNKHTFQMLRDYSIPGEVLAGLDRTVEAFNLYAAELGEDPEFALRYQALEQELYQSKLADREGNPLEDVDATADAVDTLYRQASKLVRDVETVKYSALGMLTAVDQYPNDGGNYVLTDADRESVAERLKEVQTANSDVMGPALHEIAQSLGKDHAEAGRPILSNEERKAVKEAVEQRRVLAAVDKASDEVIEAEKEGLDPVDTTAEPVSVSPASVITAPPHRALEAIRIGLADTNLGEAYRNALQAVRDVILRDRVPAKVAVKRLASDVAGLAKEALLKYAPDQEGNVWGRLGTPRKQSDPQLVAFFQEGPKTIRETLEFLKRGEPSNRSQYEKMLLQAMTQIADLDVQVEMAQKDSWPHNLEMADSRGDRGWYTYSEADGKFIYLLGPDFQDSYLTRETVLHEILHNALHHRIKAAQKAGKSDPMHEVVEELERLRVKAADYVQKNALQQQFGEAVKDIDELMSWGMLNVEFQEQVLNKVRIESKLRKNSLITGVQHVIDALVRAVFGNWLSASDRRYSGTVNLIQNVSAAMGQINREKKAAESARLTREEGSGRMGMANTSPMDYTSEQVFDALYQTTDPTTAPFREHLRGLLRSLVDRAHGPFGVVAERMRATAAVTPEEVYTKSVVSGRMPFASESLSLGLAMSEQQAFVLEQLELTVQEALGSDNKSMRDLNRLYKEARIKLTGQIPQDQFDAIFKVMELTPENRSSHLSRFAALALTNETVFRALSYTPETVERNFADLGLAGKVMAVVMKLLDALNRRLQHLDPTAPANAQIMVLVDRLVDVEAKQRYRLAHRKESVLDKATGKLEGATEGARKKLDEFATSPLFLNSRYGIIKAGGTAVGAIAGDRVDYVMNAMKELRDRTHKTRQGVTANIISEMRGGSVAAMRKATQLLREYAKKNEQERVHIKNVVASVIKGGFANQGKDITDIQWNQMTLTLLETGMHSLLDTFSMGRLEDVLRSEADLKQEITSLESQLTTRFKGEYVDAARNLAWCMVSGKNVSAELSMNAHNIAYLANTPHFNSMSRAEAEALIPVIDQLVSLYALSYTELEDRQAVAGVLVDEMLRGKGENGIENLLRQHKALEDQAKEALFNGSPIHMRKGYFAQIYDPYVSIKTATEEEGKALEAAGWRKGGNVQIDPADPKQEGRALYSVRDGGLKRKLTGTLSYTNEQSRGTKLHGGLTDVTKPGVINGFAARENRIVAQKNKRPDSRLRAFRPGYDPRKVTANKMVPILNERGQIVSHSYTMQHSTKKDVLKRNIKAFDVLGATAGKNFDKVASKEQNRTVVQALKEQYDADYAEHPHSYIKVSADSSDKGAAEAYRLLPDDTKLAVREIWGENAMYVRNDVLDITLGYRKISMADLFDVPRDQVNVVLRMFVDLLESEKVLGKKAAIRVRQAEDVWQEIVKEVKDILVIKTGVVFLGNVLSNMSALAIAGVGIKNGLYWHREAMDSLLAYNREKTELDRLKAQLAANFFPGTRGDLENEIRILEDSLARNKVVGLIEAGLMPTIVEDVDLEDEDPYSYKSHLVSKVDAWSQRVPGPVRTTARTIYMAHDTPLYKLMSEGTKMSDFVARYTLYMQVTTRARKPMSHEDAIEYVGDMFVNYDVPTGREVQYLNDMGLLFFTKYYLRIQRMLLSLMRDQPVRTLALAMLNNAMPGLPTILDSEITSRLDGVPFNAGALEIFNMGDEFLTTRWAL